MSTATTDMGFLSYQQPRSLGWKCRLWTDLPGLHEIMVLPQTDIGNEVCSKLRAVFDIRQPDRGLPS